MEKLKELVQEAYERFGEDTFSWRIFYNKIPMMEKMDKLGCRWFVQGDSPLKGISNNKSFVFEEQRGFYLREYEGKIVLSYDGEWIYCDGVWADVRKATLDEIEEEVDYEQEIKKIREKANAKTIRYN